MLEIGSISEGTLKTEDLLLRLVSQISWDEEILDDPDIRESLGESLVDLMDKLGNHVPEYCYLGMHPGDGASLGVWPCEESIRMAIHHGDLVEISAGDEFPEDGNCLVVDDHGNMTLYLGGKEQWSIV